jgi:hypothetical protein
MGVTNARVSNRLTVAAFAARDRRRHSQTGMRVTCRLAARGRITARRRLGPRQSQGPLVARGGTGSEQAAGPRGALCRARGRR